MSANYNTTRPDSPKRILMVVANPGQSPVTGWPVGFWWSELTHPYWEFIEAGFEVEIRSATGGDVQADGLSDPEDESGYSSHDLLSLGFKKSPSHAALLVGTESVESARPEDYDAVFFVGGQSPMITYRNNEALQQVVASFFESGKVTALVCHATCLLLETRLNNGEMLATGKTWTGFADSEEQFAEQIVGSKIQPFWIEEEARKLDNSNFVVDQAFRPFAVRDGLLVTGQQQFSGTEAARLVVHALGR